MRRIEGCLEVWKWLNWSDFVSTGWVYVVFVGLKWSRLRVKLLRWGLGCFLMGVDFVKNNVEVLSRNLKLMMALVWGLSCYLSLVPCQLDLLRRWCKFRWRSVTASWSRPQAAKHSLLQFKLTNKLKERFLAIVNQRIPTKKGKVQTLALYAWRKKRVKNVSNPD